MQDFSLKCTHHLAAFWLFSRVKNCSLLLFSWLSSPFVFFEPLTRTSKGMYSISWLFSFCCVFLFIPSFRQIIFFSMIIPLNSAYFVQHSFSLSFHLFLCPPHSPSQIFFLPWSNTTPPPPPGAVIPLWCCTHSRLLVHATICLAAWIF